MKLLALLLSFYIVYMVSLPCVDEAINTGKGCTEIDFGHTHHHDSNHADACSPFCVCACCNVTVELVAFLFQSNPVPTLQLQLEPYYPEHFSSYYSPIWQPPKIG